jgi:glycine oxidase
MVAMERKGSGAVDVVVIGAGAVGLAISRRLAGTGRSVAVLDREVRGASASRSAAGMLAPRGEAREPGPFFDLALASRRAFGAFAAELVEESGIELDYREDGLVGLGRDAEEESELARRAEWQRAAGFVVEELTRAEAAARWPELAFPAAPPPGESRRFAEGRLFFFPDEAQVDAEPLVDALLASCRARGVELGLGREARGLRIESGRVRAVRTAEGEVACELVVNAAGAWAGAVAGWTGEVLPVGPVRGELLAYATAFRAPRPVVAAGNAYALLRRGGRLLVGATVERAGFEARVTREGQAWLEAEAAALVPGLSGVPPAARWAGLRPGTPDDLPVIGFSPEIGGFYHAAGHFRNGILLAPATAELALAEIEAGTNADASAFSPERFAAAEGRPR